MSKIIILTVIFFVDTVYNFLYGGLKLIAE